MFSRPLVMMVEDEKELAELYCRFLEISGFDCNYFTDPQSALDNIRKNFRRYCLVIADLRMPGLDGLEFTRRLRKYNKTVKVLLITGFLAEENIDHEATKRIGISAVLEKPFHVKDFGRKIKEILVSSG